MGNCNCLSNRKSKEEVLIPFFKDPIWYEIEESTYGNPTLENNFIKVT